jgi:hypothetical protein
LPQSHAPFVALAWKSRLYDARIHPTQNNTGSSKRYTTASCRMRIESASHSGYQTVY